MDLTLLSGVVRNRKVAQTTHRLGLGLESCISYVLTPIQTLTVNLTLTLTLILTLTLTLILTVNLTLTLTPTQTTIRRFTWDRRRC
jgi:hypothetical protein